MAETPENPPIYDALVALKPDKLSFNAWALKAGLNRNVFNDIRRNGNAEHATIEKLLGAADRSWAELDALMPVRTEVRSASEANQIFKKWGDPPAGRVPLLGAAVGGNYGNLRDIELTELHLGEVLDWLGRPDYLENDVRAYALTVMGLSMEPVFPEGVTVLVSPRAQVHPGDNVIVQLRGEDEDDRVTMVLIKKLVRRTPESIELRQYNPDMTFQVPLNRIGIGPGGRPLIHKVSSALF